MAVLNNEYSIQENRGTVQGEGVVASIECRFSTRLKLHQYLIEAVWLTTTHEESKDSNRTTLRLSREEAVYVVEELSSLLRKTVED